MKICGLQSFASLVLACLWVDRIAIAEGRQSNTAGTTRVAADTAANREAKAASAFGGVSYFQRWAQDAQCEFTPTGQKNLEEWSDMITFNVYPSAHDSDTHARSACRAFYRCCFWSIKFSRGGVCPFQISGRHRLVDLSTRIAYTARKSATK